MYARSLKKKQSYQSSPAGGGPRVPKGPAPAEDIVRNWIWIPFVSSRATDGSTLVLASSLTYIGPLTHLQSHLVSSDFVSPKPLCDPIRNSYQKLMHNIHMHTHSHSHNHAHDQLPRIRLK